MRLFKKTRGRCILYVVLSAGLVCMGCGGDAGKAVEYWPNGAKRAAYESTVNKTNGQRAIDGNYDAWHENGIKEMRATYEKGVLRGPVRIWREDGTLSIGGEVEVAETTSQFSFRQYHENFTKAVEGQFLDGNLDGTVSAWWPSGQKRMEAVFAGGVLNGTSKQWFLSGQIEKVVNHKGGVLNGQIEEWDADGTLRLSGQMADGKFDGALLINDENGNKIAELTLVAGAFDNTQTVYYSNGARKWQVVYTDGQLNGTATMWHERSRDIDTKDGQKSLEIDFKNGVLHGNVRGWDEAGEQVIDVEYVDGEAQTRRWEKYQLNRLFNDEFKDQFGATLKEKFLTFDTPETQARFVVDVTDVVGARVFGLASASVGEVPLMSAHEEPAGEELIEID